MKRGECDGQETMVSSRNTTLTNCHRFLGQMMVAANLPMLPDIAQNDPLARELALSTIVVHGKHAEGFQ